MKNLNGNGVTRKEGVSVRPSVRSPVHRLVRNTFNFRPLSDIRRVYRLVKFLN